MTQTITLSLPAVHTAFGSCGAHDIEVVLPVDFAAKIDARYRERTPAERLRGALMNACPESTIRPEGKSVRSPDVKRPLGDALRDIFDGRQPYSDDDRDAIIGAAVRVLFGRRPQTGDLPLEEAW